MTVAIKLNEELNGIELYFASKPESSVLSELKENGFRWSSFKKCWYSRQTDKAFQVAESLTGGNVSTPIKEVTANNVKVASKPKRAKKEDFNLWNATRWTDIEVDGEQETKEIAKEIRSHIRKRFPQCKFSVRVPYYGKLTVEIKSSPYEKDSVYLKAIQEYCNKLANAYQVCYNAGDPYSDIAASYNFHFFNTSICYDYTQTEVTEEIKKDMENFDTKLSEHEQAEEEKKRQEFLQWQKEQEKKKAEYEQRMEEKKKQVENIYNSVDVKELEENNQYFVTGVEFAHLNKNSRIEQYMEEVAKGDFSTEDVKVTKEVHFDSLDVLENFSNLLLNDFEFLANTGGSYTDDNRINSMTDFYNMDEYEKQTVKWNRSGVAIYFDNELQFIVDAQGYSYARYVGLTDNAKIKKDITVNQVLSDEEITELKFKADELEDISTSVIDELDIVKTWNGEDWKQYKEVMKDKLNRYNFKLTKEVVQQLDIEELKAAMYRLLTEVDDIQEQFKKADIQQGDKVTLFYISDWGSIVTERITVDSVEATKYAQYNNVIKLIYTPEGRRKQYYKYFYSTLLVYEGWQSLPETVLHYVEERDGWRTTRGKYHSTDKRQYDEILGYFEGQGLKPIVNTYNVRL